MALHGKQTDNWQSGQQQLGDKWQRPRLGGRTDTTVWTAPPTAGTADSQLMSGTWKKQQEGSSKLSGDWHCIVRRTGVHLAGAASWGKPQAVGCRQF